jgi:hypothetical protein
VFLSAESAERTIRVRIEHEPATHGFVAELMLVDSSGRSLGARTVQTSEPDCRALEPALVLVISTLVGIAREPEPQPTPASPPPAPEPSSAAAPSPRFVSEPTLRGDVTHLRLSLGIGAQGALGLLPGFAPLAQLDLFAHYGAFMARLGVGAAPYGQEDLEEGARASFRALHGGLQLCAIATDRALGLLSFCAGAKAGVLAARTSGLAANRQTTEPYVLLSAGPTLELPIGGAHALFFGIGAFFPALAPRYYYVERNESRRYYHTVELGLLVEIGWLFDLLS